MISPLPETLLDARHVALELRGATVAEAVFEISEVFRETGALHEVKKFYQAVMEREEKSSTATNGGVAFPHARTDQVDELVVGIGRSKSGVPFQGTAELVHLIFVIAVPQQMVNDYLVCVGSLARRLSDENIRAALMTASDANEFLHHLRGES